MAQAMIDAANWTLGVVTKQYGSAQFQIDSALPTSNFDGVGGWEGYFPMQAANDITTAEAIKKILQLVPQSSAWFDCSTTASTGGPGNADGDPLPTFRVNTEKHRLQPVTTKHNCRSEHNCGREEFIMLMLRRGKAIAGCLLVVSHQQILAGERGWIPEI